MDIQTLSALKSKFVTREVGTELIVVPLSGNVAQMNELFTLNETAKLIWENLDEKNTLEELESIMVEAFDRDNETAKKDIELFLNRLEKLFNKAN